jgi:hypothetical protein
MKHFFYILTLLWMTTSITEAAVQAPILKWKYGGCYSSWCETGWYSSPAVADLDGDGSMEIVASAYSVVALKGTTGEVIWRVDSGKDRTSSPGYSHRTWPGIWIKDIDGDHSPEIITAHSGGYVSVYNNHGYFKSGWPRRPTTNELRGLVVSDIDDDGSAEIIVTGATYGKINTWVFEHNGSLRPGWPQLGNDSGSAWGVFNDNAWVDDLDNDGFKEIIVPSDVTTLCAYRPNGVQVNGSSIYGNKKWGAVGTWESLSTELRGWGHCDGVRAESYRSNFAHGAAVVADVDGDGTREVVVTGNMYDCHAGYPPAKYTSLFIFNADRSRFKRGPWNWEQAPVNIGAPLSEDYHVIESCQPNPVVVDLDGDQIKEILFASYDGRMHAFRLDKAEHDNWPYSIYHSSEGFYRFASEPVVADLDRDGCSEVIFTSWVQKTSSGLRLGKLHILDCHGNMIHEQNLPAPKSSSRHENGALPAPTIANIDADPDYELVINTINSGFIAYDLPGSARAKIQWQSGRNRGGSIENTITVVPMMHLLLHR